MVVPEVTEPVKVTDGALPVAQSKRGGTLEVRRAGGDVDAAAARRPLAAGDLAERHVAAEREVLHRDGARGALDDVVALLRRDLRAGGVRERVARRIAVVDGAVDRAVDREITGAVGDRAGERDLLAVKAALAVMVVAPDTTVPLKVSVPEPEAAQVNVAEPLMVVAGLPNVVSMLPSSLAHFTPATTPAERLPLRVVPFAVS